MSPRVSSSSQPIGHLTHVRHSDGTPKPDGALKNVTRSKILYHHRLYLDHPDPIVSMSLVVNTSGRLYDNFIRLFFFHTAHRETSDLTNEVPEESDQFRFLHVVCLDNLKGSILVKVSVMRVSIPLDL